MSNINNIKEQYQLNSILDIYGGHENNQTVNTAFQYYIDHNTISDGIILSDKITPVNGLHKISNSYYYFDENNYDITKEENSHNPFSKFYPILSSYNTYFIENNYKLISAKDIDYENAYLKYAQPSYDYDAPITYFELNVDVDGSGEIIEKECNTGTTYSFGRKLSSYINNTYDLLNIVDYLLNRVNCLNFLLDIIKKQKNVAN